MPRINIEEKWWSDPRRSMLIVELGLEADSAMLNAIRLSQMNNGESFDARGVMPERWIQALGKVGLAIGTSESLYVKGSKEFNEWIRLQRANASKGGKALRNKNNELQQAVAKRTVPTAMPSSSSSSSSSTSTSTSTSSSKRYAVGEPIQDTQKTILVKNEFLESYKKEFGHDYPGWGAKENSQASSWLRSVPIAKAIDLCRLYPKWNDPWVTKQGHPFGILITQYVQLDAWAMSSEKRIQKIAQGKAMENVTVKRAIQREETKNGIREFVEQAGNDSVLSGKDKKQFPNGTTERIPGGAFGLPEGPF